MVLGCLLRGGVRGQLSALLVELWIDRVCSRLWRGFNIFLLRVGTYRLLIYGGDHEPSILASVVTSGRIGSVRLTQASEAGAIASAVDEVGIASPLVVASLPAATDSVADDLVLAGTSFFPSLLFKRTNERQVWIGRHLRNVSK